MFFKVVAPNETKLRFQLKVELLQYFLEVERSVGSDWIQKGLCKANKQQSISFY